MFPKILPLRRPFHSTSPSGTLGKLRRGRCIDPNGHDAGNPSTDSGGRSDPLRGYPEAVARYLALETYSLECYRSLSDGPAYHKFDKYVRYTVDGLDAWAASCRRVTTTWPAAPGQDD
jgi:hypothetical protein